LRAESSEVLCFRWSLLSVREVRINRFALTELRQRSGFTKSEFARAIGVSPPHITDIEAGRRNPSATLIVEMARILKVPLPAILSDPANLPLPVDIDDPANPANGGEAA
jgi:transcriptional regulator with XRE-family HTH domain